MSEINIEQFLFRKDGGHGLSYISMQRGKLTIKVIPWEYGDREKTYVFESFKLISISCIDGDPREFEFPWDIIGVDAKQLKGKIWSFGIHCSGVEYGFDSEWPYESK